ncbi:hypothetical protein ACFVFS_10105 [Kitasatospora sp. NPDC057692]|uniref:hypothetical protein n=1 Tax=Kitasatospora sp. NPDC057692 TaxID=3346215 RepID=UPI0036C636DE
MSTNRSRRIDRDTAEQLLAGAVGGPSAGRDASLTGPDGNTGHTGPLRPGDGPEKRVARVLAAAAAPAARGELAREEAALAAFREARLAPAPAVPAAPAPVRRRSMATAALTRAFSTKAVAVVLGATALGGVAVAAGTGNLPSALGGGGSDEPKRHVVAPVTSAPASAAESRSGTPSAGGPSARPLTAAPTGGTSAGPSGGPAAADPSAPANRPTAPQPPAATPGDGRGPSNPVAHAALCKAFSDRAGKGERPRTLVTDPQFGGLVGAAGGTDKVEDYCARLLREAGDGDRQGGPAPTRSGAAASGSGGGGGGGNGQGSGGSGQGSTGQGSNGQGSTGQGAGGQGSNSQSANGSGDNGGGSADRTSKPVGTVLPAPPTAVTPALPGQTRTDRVDKPDADTSGNPR